MYRLRIIAIRGHCHKYEMRKIRSFCYFEHFVRYAVSYIDYRFRHVKTDRLRIKRETRILYTIVAKKQEDIQTDVIIYR